MTELSPSHPPATNQGLTTSLKFVISVACGLTAANLYYGQPLAGPISTSLGLPPGAAGLVVTLAQIGYSLGLLFLAPLGDMLENRRLTVTLLSLAGLSLLGAGLSSHPTPFFISMLGIGLGTVAVQILLPYAAHFTPEASRGKVVGNITSGLMFGIMLARPIASFITEWTSWHAVFILSATMMGAVAVALSRSLTPRQPPSSPGYISLLRSMIRLFATTSLLRRRAFYQAALFCAFSLFWTTVPLLLSSPAFGLSHQQIGLFALVGAAGGIATPIAGRLADRGWSHPATAWAILLSCAAFLIGTLASSGTKTSLACLGFAAIILDFGTAANLTLGQRAIFMLGDEIRSRLNSLYMTTFFIGGATGSALGGWVYATAGWHWTAVVGFLMPAIALAYFATEGAPDRSKSLGP